MSFYKPLNSIEQEVKNNYSIPHPGIVIDNNDPEKLGKLRVMIDIWADIPVELIPWATPKMPCFLGLSRNSIMGSIPEIGSEVIITFPTMEKYNPEYSGHNMTVQNKNPFLDEDYPNTYGFKDSIGNLFKINKIQKNIKLQHSSGTNFEIYSIEGDVVIKHCDYTDENDNTTTGAYIRIDKFGKIYHNCKDFQVDASNSILMNTKNFRLDASNSILMNTLNTYINSLVHILGNTDITGNEFITGDETIGGNSTATDHLSSGKSGKGHTHSVLSEHYGNTSEPQ